MNAPGSASPAPAYADVKIHIFDRQAAGYPVELTLDGEREFPRGHLSPDVLRLLSSDIKESAAGERLSELLFADPCLREAWAETRGSSPRRRVRLRIDPVELGPLPWELLPSAPGKPPLSLAADQNTPFETIAKVLYTAGQVEITLPDGQKDGWFNEYKFVVIVDREK